MPSSPMRLTQAYEWREAARFALVPPHVFASLDIEEQASIIAHYQTHQRIHAVLEHERAKEMRRRGNSRR